MTAKSASKSSKPAAKTSTKPAIGTGSPKLDRTLARAAAKESKPEATPAPAAKEPSLKTAGAKPEGEARSAAIPAEAKLVVLAKENPKRGKNARRIFDLYSKCATVGAWREAMKREDLDQGYLHGDLRRGLIKVVLPTLRETAKGEK